MARSTYIYILLWNEEVRAAFTVKHEPISYLEYHHPIENAFTRVIRTRDAGAQVDIIDVTKQIYKELS